MAERVGFQPFNAQPCVDVAVKRLVCARKAIDQTGEDVVLVVHTEGLLIDPAAVTVAIDQLVAFADA